MSNDQATSMSEVARRPPKVLIVDDQPANLFALEQVLVPLDIQMISARSGDEALSQTLRHDFALVLLDVQMPGMDGFETASLLRQNERTRHMPIIFVTAISKDERYVFKGYEAGAVDYLFKPIEPHILRSKVQVFIDLYCQRRALEQALESLRQSHSDVERMAFALRGLVGSGSGLAIDPDEMCRRIHHVLSEEARAVEATQRQPIFIEFLGMRYGLPGDARPLLRILVSTFEEVVRMSYELRRTHRELEREITVRKEAEDKAVQASEAKGRFLSWLSHELRTPLNAIIGFSEMIMAEATDRGVESMYDEGQHIQAAGLQLLQIIGNLLDMAKLEAGKMSVSMDEFDVHVLLDEVAGIMAPLARQNRNQLRRGYAAELGVMRSDRLKLRQILYNLLGNACKFTHDGVIELAAARTQVNGEDSLVFRVTDTGVGIAPEDIGTLFDAFVQVESSRLQQEGSGLGLAITKSFCALLSGTIEVESALRRGSTFTVTLPASLQTARARLSSAVSR